MKPGAPFGTPGLTYGVITLWGSGDQTTTP